jgi:putative phosphonate metabolism protein
MTARYALYFAPAQGSPWWEFGTRWLGHDECLDRPMAQPALAQIGPAELFAATEQPRRYGFHATLKAPFALSGGHTLDDLVTRLHALAATLKPVALGPMQAALLGDFVALVPVTVPDELAALANTCVTCLDDLRAPLSAADLLRRRVEHLDAREQALLAQYGYPYVLERYRLHLTLSGPVAPPMAQHLLQAAATPVAQLNARAPLVLDRLCLFVESSPGQSFKRLIDAELPA